MKAPGEKGEWNISKASLARELKRLGRVDVQAALEGHEERIADHEERIAESEALITELVLAGATRNPPERAAQDTGFLSAFLGAAGKVAP